MNGPAGRRSPRLSVRSFCLLLALVAGLLAGCTGGTAGGGNGGAGAGDGTDPSGTGAGVDGVGADGDVVPGEPVTLTVLAGSELEDVEPLLERVSEASGVRLDLTYTGTLTGTERILAGERFDLAWFSHGKYLELLTADTEQVVASTPIMLSPVTIGVRRPVADRMGWTNGPVSWADLARASAAGELRFAMTNPAASNSGFTALIAVATALADTGGALDADDVATLDLAGFFQGQALTAGSSGWLADAFSAEGSDLDAMVNYESILAADDSLVILYPSEGVVTADYPLILLDPAREEAYDRLVAALLQPDFQAEISAATLRRPVVPGVAPAPGVPDVAPTEIPFPAQAATIDALVFAYLDEERPAAHTIYLLDVSGSMEGQPLDDLKAALTGLTGVDDTLAGRFTRFRRRERVTMIPFSTNVGAATTFEVDDVETDSAVLADIRSYIDGLVAEGDTALYSGLEAAYRTALEAAASDPGRFYSVVLLSDGAATTGPELDTVLAGPALTDPGAQAIRTFPILFGQSDRAAMERVAGVTGGLVFDSGGDLSAAFKTIRGYQ